MNFQEFRTILTANEDVHFEQSIFDHFADLDSDCKMFLFGIDFPSIEISKAEQLETYLKELEADKYSPWNYEKKPTELNNLQRVCREVLICVIIMQFCGWFEDTLKKIQWRDMVKICCESSCGNYNDDIVELIDNELSKK